MKNTEEQTILLIEDNPGDIRLIKDMLKEITSFNYKLIIAETLKDGCEQIKNNDLILILLDLNLPDSSGRQTFDNVLKFAKHIPIVLISDNDNSTSCIPLTKTTGIFSAKFITVSKVFIPELSGKLRSSRMRMKSFFLISSHPSFKVSAIIS